MLLTPEVQHQLTRIGDSKLTAIVHALEKAKLNTTNIPLEIHHVLKIATHQLLTHGVSNLPPKTGLVAKTVAENTWDILVDICGESPDVEYIQKIRLLSKRLPMLPLVDDPLSWILCDAPVQASPTLLKRFDDLYNSRLSEFAVYYRHVEHASLLRVDFPDHNGVKRKKYFLENGRVVSCPTNYYITFMVVERFFYEIINPVFPLTINHPCMEAIKLTGDINTITTARLPDNSHFIWLKAKRKAMVIQTLGELKGQPFVEKILNELVLPSQYNDDVIMVAAKMLAMGLGEFPSPVSYTVNDIVRRIQPPSEYRDKVFELLISFVPN